MKKVIIVLGNTVTALSTLRALKSMRQKYHIILATTNKTNNIAFQSNIPHQKLVLQDGVVQGLLTLSAHFDTKPMLLFTRDDEVVEVSENREKLSPYYRFMLPDHSLVTTLMEKAAFSEFAEAHHLLIPRTYFINNSTELLNVGKKLSYPIYIKPYLLHAIKVINESQLQQLTEELQPVHYRSMIAQESVEGEDDNLYFCFLLFDQNGQVVQSMTARKLRQWPISYGTTSLAITVNNAPLQYEIQQFIQSVNMSGYCSIEYKYSAKTQRYYIMEPTIGRFNQQIALSAACGVNFPVAMVQLMENESLPAKQQKDNVFWIYESHDLLSYLKSNKKYSYLNNFFKPNTKVLFSLSDPQPFLSELYDVLTKNFRKIFSNG